MLSSEKVLEIIREAYESVRLPQRWPSFLGHLRDATRAEAAGSFVQDIPAQTGTVLCQVGGDPASVSRYHDYYARINPWFRMARARQGEVRVGRARDVRGTEYYEDFWHPQGFDDTLTAYTFSGAERCGGVTVTRRRGAPAFSAEDLSLFSALVEHLQQVQHLREQLDRFESSSQVLLEILERVPQGIVVLDPRGRVLALNRGAQALLRGDSPLHLVAGEIQLRAPREAAAFARLVSGAIRTALGQGSEPGGSLRVHVDPEQQPLWLVVTPLPVSPSLFGLGTPAVLVFLSRLGAGPTLELPRVQQLFGVTTAEARIAIGIARGLTVPEISRSFKITANTVRTHLKRVYEKTGTQNQAALASLLCTSAAALVAAPRRS